MIIKIKEVNLGFVDLLYFGSILSLIIYTFHGFDLYIFLPILLGATLALVFKLINKLIKKPLIRNLALIGIMSIAFGCLLKFVYHLDRVLIISIIFFIALTIRQLKIKKGEN